MTSANRTSPWDRIPNFRQRLREKQVDELFLFMPSAVAFSFVGALAALVAFIDTGDRLMGLAWFSYAVVVLFVRGVTVFAYRQTPKPVSNAAWWGRMMLIGNLLAGIQWGLLGTVCYPVEHNYRELFTVLVITSFVAGSITAFSPVKWVHLAMAIPASLPPAIYIFFMRDGSNWVGGSMSLFFVCCVLFFSYKQYHIVAARLIVELDNEELLSRSLETNKSLSHSNSELRLITVNEQEARQEASARARLLGAHVAGTLLPIAECDGQGNIVAWNAAAESALGYRAKDVFGQNFASLLLPAEAQIAGGAAIKQQLREERASTLPMLMQNRTGTRLPMQLYLTPMEVNGGVPVRVGVMMSPLQPFQTDTKVARAA
jgi:PAS domain S-box-containing protein